MSEDQVSGPAGGKARRSPETAQPPSAMAQRTTPPPLARGNAVAGGRYRLEAPHGGGDGLRYWQARDLRLGRDVALVFVDAPAAQDRSAHGDDNASATALLDRSLALSRLWAPGLAGVLDVVRGKAGGIIVAEWTPGVPLAEAAADKRLAASAHSVLRPLADAAARVDDADAHLGLVSPDQVRVTPDGSAVLSFPGVAANASAQRDVRGLGAVLYALQTGTWPLDLPPGAADLPVTAPRLPAARREGATPVDPQTLGAPAGMAALAMRALDGTSVSSPGTVLSLLEDDTPRAPHVPPTQPVASTPSSHGQAAAPAATDDDAEASWSDADYVDTPARTPLSPEERRKTQQRHWFIMAAAGALALVAIIAVLIQMIGGFGGRGDDTPLADKLDALQQQAQASRDAEAAANGDGAAPAAPETPEGSPVTITAAESWQPSNANGDAENSAQASNVFDDDQSTSWRTDTYRAQFGTEPSAYKEGLGLLLTLDEAVRITQVTVTSPDSSVRIEVRSVDTSRPTSLDDTTLLGSGTTTGSGPIDIEVDDTSTQEPTSSVLVWVTALAGSDASGYQAQIQEIAVEGIPD